MWLFTTTGAYSIVKHKDRPDLYLIRSFSKADMQRLIEANECLHNVEIIEMPHADYHYRIIVSQDRLEQVMRNTVKNIDYISFKDKVSHKQGKHRYSTYLNIHNLLKQRIEAEA